MHILGISAFYHDSAACLVTDGRIVAAAQEERFTRKKHDARFPESAIRYCLDEAKVGLQDVDYVVFYEKPFLKFERLLDTYLRSAPCGFPSFVKAMPLWLKEKLFQRDLITKKLKAIGGRFDADRLLFTEHHQSHAASAFYPSPFKEAAILTMDGVGEWATTSFGRGEDNTLELLKEIQFPDSLGLLYSAFTYYTGFKVNSGEYKVMGLAPYGKPRFAQAIFEHLIDLKEDGSFRLNQDYFDYRTGLTMTNKRFDSLFGGPPRAPESQLTQREMDLAASVQAVTEEVVLRIAKYLAGLGISRNLCLAGGVALNCVANGKLRRAGYFDDIWVQSAAGDAGGALGGALACYYHFLGKPRTVEGRDSMRGAYLGPSFAAHQAAAALTNAGAKFHTLGESEIIEKTARALADGKAVGWFRGRMEFGPRALGARSILGNPMRPDTQRTLNLKVKYRESFRPFAPSVLREDVAEWFGEDKDSPYMLMVDYVRWDKRHQMTAEENSLFGIDKLNVVRSDVPAITHVDFSARIQTVHRDTNPDYHALISAFKTLTSCPMLVNTSFNIRGEPIVCTPEDAFRCFMGTGLDVLVVENHLLEKEEQNTALLTDYVERFQPD
jgi:carbamoyltransferase